MHEAASAYVRFQYQGTARKMELNSVRNWKAEHLDLHEHHFDNSMLL